MRGRRGGRRRRGGTALGKGGFVGKEPGARWRDEGVESGAAALARGACRTRGAGRGGGAGRLHGRGRQA